MTSASESQGERAAEIEAAFRRANEVLYRRFQELGAADLAPFLCECGDDRCTQTIRLTLEEYEEARGRPGRFVVVPGQSSRSSGSSRPANGTRSSRSRAAQAEPLFS